MSGSRRASRSEVASSPGASSASSQLPNVTITIPGVDVIADSHVTFTVIVTLQNSDGVCWRAPPRRYGDFEQLHADVRRALSRDAGAAASLPELPPKALRLGLRRFEPDFLEDRRARLEAYLSRLVSVAPPATCEPVDDFLSYAAHALRETVVALGAVPELASVVRTLRAAADSATASATANARTAADESDGDESGGRSSAAGGSSGGSAIGGGSSSPPASRDLLPVLRDAVTSLTDFAAVMRSRAEDTAEGTRAFSRARDDLLSRGRARAEDADDAEALLASTRAARARDLEREHAALATAARSLRTVVAEADRVAAERAALSAIAAAHGRAVAVARAAVGTAWEVGTDLGAHEAHAARTRPVAKVGQGAALAASVDAAARALRAARAAIETGEKGDALAPPPNLTAPLSGPSLAAALLISAIAGEAVRTAVFVQRIRAGDVARHSPPPEAHPSTATALSTATATTAATSASTHPSNGPPPRSSPALTSTTRTAPSLNSGLLFANSSQVAAAGNPFGGASAGGSGVSSSAVSGGRGAAPTVSSSGSRGGGGTASSAAAGGNPFGSFGAEGGGSAPPAKAKQVAGNPF